MTELIKYSQIGVQDLSLGTGTFQVTLADGRVVTMDQISLGQIPGDVSHATVTATGSTTSRTLATRFADWFNVKDYGAIGNGTTDDTTAIQAAITAAQAVAGTVWFPTGTYKITAQLSITATVQLVGSGWGSIIKVDSAVTRFIPILVEGAAYAAIKGVVLRDLKLDGSSKCTLDAGMIQMNNAVDFECSHLWLTAGGTPGESGVSGVNGIACSAGAIGGTGAQGIIQGCLIEATTKAGINWSTESVNGLIIGNIVRNCTGNTSTPGIQAFGGYNVTVSGNFVYENQGYGIFLGVSGGVGTYRHSRYAIVSDNHVYSNGQGTTVGEGIMVANAAASTSQFGRIVIRGNQVYSNGVGVNAHGIHIQNENNVRVEQNYVYLNSLNGVMVEAAQNVHVCNNTLETNNTANASNGSGVYIKAAAGATLGSILVSDNKCSNASNQKYPVYYDNAAAQTVSDVMIVDNAAAGHSTSNALFFDYELPQRFYLRHYANGQSTTDATATNAFYAILRDNSAATVRMKTVCVKSDGSDRAMYDRTGLLYRDGGGATLQGSLQTAFEVESDATWDQTIDVTGNYVRGRITGKAATTITWDSTIEIHAE